MKNWNKITKENHPKDGDYVDLTDGERTINAKWCIDNGEHSFIWIPNSNQKGICLMTNPTHFI